MSDQSNDRVSISIEGGVADVRLNRPDKMNALDAAMFDGILAAGEALAATPGLRAVVLSGEGRAFCAGLDMASFGSVGQEVDLKARSHGVSNRFQRVAMQWHELAVPVIAAVHGVCFGGGLQIASGADIRICAPDTRLSVMEMKWGLVPDMAGYALWRGRVREDVLRELIYTNRELTGAEGVELGLMTYADTDPLARALSLARTIASRHPQAIRAAKRIANAMQDETGPALLMAESVEQDELMRSPNQKEAVFAQMQKREPVFID